MPLIAIIAIAAFAAVQTPATKYDGTWIGTVNGAVTGGISLGDIEVNEDGRR